tara:strand:- start:6154 stop:6831 length:678 start_codon:yes stop_codon:yes gene_type:complete
MAIPDHQNTTSISDTPEYDKQSFRNFLYNKYYDDTTKNTNLLEEDFLNMLPDDIREFIEQIIYENDYINYIINYIKDNYIYIFIIIIIIITIYIFSNNIYDYINNIFSPIAVQKKNIETFNNFSIDNDVYDDNLVKKKMYDPLFKNNMILYKDNLNTRLLYIKNNIDTSIKHHLSQSKPNYRLISLMKKYKDKINTINLENKIDYSAIEKDFETINKKIINLLIY